MPKNQTLVRIEQNDRIRKTAERNAQSGFDQKEDELRLAASTGSNTPPTSEEIETMCMASPD